MKTVLLKLTDVTRAKDWRYSFVPFIIGCVYLWLFLFAIPFNLLTIQLLFLLLLTTFGFASFGYFINDYFDRETDKVAGKINHLSVVSPRLQILIFSASLTTAFLPWLWLPSDKITGLLIAAEVMLFLFYSLPFPRLKDMPVLSGIVDASYAYVIPFLLIFYTCSLHARQEYQLVITYLVAGVFIIGFRNITIHQVNDIIKDKSSGTITLPQKIGPEKTNLLILILLVLEFLFLLFSFILISFQHHFLFFWVLFYFFFVVIRAIQIRSLFKTKDFFKQQVRHLTDVAYQLWFPLIMLILIITTDWRWILLIPLHVGLLIPAHHLNKFMEWILFVKNILIIHIYFPVRYYLSLFVNYTIYYFFLLFGVDLKKQNKSALQYLKALFKRLFGILT